MNYANIKLFDPANGFGLRTNLFVAGCNHACPGCFNAVAQDFNAGKEFTDDTISIIIESLRHPGVRGLTILGGEPMDPRNQKEVSRLITEVRRVFKDTKDIWVWTGYVYPRDFNASKNARAVTEYTETILSQIDVLVDGPFVWSKCDLRLRFRGSYNQRVIDMQKSRKENEIILVDIGESPEDLEKIKASIRKRNEKRNQKLKDAR